MSIWNSAPSPRLTSSHLLVLTGAITVAGLLRLGCSWVGEKVTTPEEVCQPMALSDTGYKGGAAAEEIPADCIVLTRTMTDPRSPHMLTMEEFWDHEGRGETVDRYKVFTLVDYGTGVGTKVTCDDSRESVSDWRRDSLDSAYRVLFSEKDSARGVTTRRPYLDAKEKAGVEHLW